MPISVAAVSIGGGFVVVSSCATLVGWMQNRIKRNIPMNSGLEQTLILSLRDVDIMNALKAAAACFFREVRHFDEVLDLKLAEHFQTKMKAYLELFSSVCVSSRYFIPCTL